MTASQENTSGLGTGSIPSTSHQSALSTRISDVLSTSFSDLEIRDSLQVLDEREFRNTAESRRGLWLDVQEEVIRRNGEIHHDFKGVADDLRRVQGILSRLTAISTEMKAHIEEANKTTKPAMDEAATLFAQRKDVETKQVILQGFQKHFILSDEEHTALTSSSEPINDLFFSALSKLKVIHSDSQTLLSSANDRLGLSILDSSSKTLNSAFQKLFKWTQREFRTLDLENPRLGRAMRRALRVLAERPALFTGSLDNFAATREEILSNSFHTALTGQGDMVVGRAIDFQAHDPLRYISDMLAWVHSGTIGEREALEGLFIGEGDELAQSIKKGRDDDPWSRREDGEVAEPFDGRKALNDLVCRDLAGVAKQLRQRAEQVIQSQEDAVIAYRIANLVVFYKSTFRKLLGDEADIMATLDSLEETAQRQFRVLMNDQVASMKMELTQGPASPSPPDFFTEALETLTDIIKNYETSLASANPDTTAIDDVLLVALDPFLEGALSLSNRLPPPQNDIFAGNCYLKTISILKPYPFASSRINSLTSELKSRTESLISYQHDFFRSASGLGPLIEALSMISTTDVPAIRMVPLLQNTKALQNMSARLDDFLPSALMDAMDEIKGLQSASLVREITEEAAELFCDEFEMVERKILAVDAAGGLGGLDDDDDDDDSTTGQVHLREVFPRTIEEIRVLLS